MRDLHGLLASATALYRAAGLDVVVNVRAPDTTHIVEDELRRRDFLDFFRYVVPKQALYRSVTGVHSHYRQTHETRPAKREWRLDLGFDADLGDVKDELRPLASTEEGTHRLLPESESSVSWIVTGRTATELRPAIEQAIDEEVLLRRFWSAMRGHSRYELMQWTPSSSWQHWSSSRRSMLSSRKQLACSDRAAGSSR